CWAVIHRDLCLYFFFKAEDVIRYFHVTGVQTCALPIYVPDLFARNERLVCLFDTEYGKAAVVMVGAMIVAGIETVATGKIARTEDIQEAEHNMSFAKGDELGRFYLGSTAIVVLPKGAKADWQDSMQANSVVQMGQLLGVANAK